MPTKPRTKRPAAADNGELPYPEYRIEMYRGNNAITDELCKQWLGWEEKERMTPGCCEELHAITGQCAVLRNNANNRPIDAPWLEKLVQIHCTREFLFNGVDVIGIDQSGQVATGQHRLLSLVIARWKQQSAEHKEAVARYWGNEPITMESLVAFGVDPTDRTFRTINQGLAATGGDIFFRQFFKHGMAVDRKAKSHILQFAVRTLWDRIGYRDGTGFNAFAPQITTDQMVHFVERHPRLLEAVEHVHTENMPEMKHQVDSKGRATGVMVRVQGAKPRIARWVNTGTAAALLYLMGTSGTNADMAKAYRSSAPPTEEGLDASLWDRATEFWTLLPAVEKKKLEGIRDAMYIAGCHRLTGKAETPDDVPKTEVVLAACPRPERVGCIALGWEKFANHHEVAAEACENQYKEAKDEHGDRVRGALKVHPSCGGIDLAGEKEPTDLEVLAEDEVDAPEEQDDPEEVAARAEEIRQANLKALKERHQKRKGKLDDQPPAAEEPEPPSFEDELDTLREHCPKGAVMLLQAAKGALNAWGNDARRVCTICKLSFTVVNKMSHVVISKDAVDACIAKLVKVGDRVALVERLEGGNCNVRTVGEGDAVDGEEPPAEPQPRKKGGKPPVETAEEFNRRNQAEWDARKAREAAAK